MLRRTAKRFFLFFVQDPTARSHRCLHLAHGPDKIHHVPGLERENMLDTALGPVFGDRLLDQVHTECQRRNVYFPSGRMVGIGDRVREHALECRD